MATQFTARALESAPTKDKFVYLKPTSPLREANDIDAALELLTSSGSSAVVSVTAVSEHPELMYRMPGSDCRLEPAVAYLGSSRGQDSPRRVRLSGAIYNSFSPTLRLDGNSIRLALHGYDM